jgi:hypothetical protein
MSAGTGALSTRDRTVTLSLRMSEAAYKALQEDANRQNISLNTIANQILIAYSEYDRYLKKHGMLKLTRSAFAAVLDAATDEAILEAGKAAGTGVFPSLILSATGELTTPAILEWLKRLGTYSNLADYSEISHGGKISVTMSHDFGLKGSLFLAGYFESLFRLSGKQIKVLQLKDSVTFEI